MNVYAATPKDVCKKCKHPIGDEEYGTALKLDPSWDRKEKFNFDIHVTDEFAGYAHLRCL